ncbi:hypothetical protein Plhal304r1_c037g0113381 [Plasmopara halstedii]
MCRRRFSLADCRMNICTACHMTTERDKRLQPLVAWFVFAIFYVFALGNSLVVKLVIAKDTKHRVVSCSFAFLTLQVALLVMID